MNQIPERGEFATLPFARLLGTIWQKELSGFLRVRSGLEEKIFSFQKGRFTLEKDNVDERAFIRYLLTSGNLDLVTANELEEEKEGQGFSLIRLLLEKNIIEPDILWQKLESYLKEDIFAVLDWEDGIFEFTAALNEQGQLLLQNIDTSTIMLEGIRQMSNVSIIERFLPDFSDKIKSSSSLSLHRLALTSYEKYLLSLLDGEKTVQEIINASELASNLSCQTLFAFLCLGLAYVSNSREKTTRFTELNLAELEKIFENFNHKFSSIFRYLSKEIGPVAPSIIEKAVEEVRPNLDSSFSGIKLLPDGRLELKTSLRLNMNIISEEGKKNFLRSLDEILMAETLAVRRTLGPAHESQLLRYLEKIGED